MGTFSRFIDQDPKVRSHARVDDTCIGSNSRNLFKGRLIGKDAGMGFFAREDHAIGTSNSEGGQALAHSSKSIFDLCKFS